MAARITTEEYEEAMMGIGIKCSQLINLLSGFISEHGDLPININRKSDETTHMPMDNLGIVVSHDLTMNKKTCDFLLSDRF